MYKILVKMFYEEKTEVVSFINNCETCTRFFLEKDNCQMEKFNNWNKIKNKKLVEMAKYLSIARGFQIPSININFVNCSMLIC